MKTRDIRFRAWDSMNEKMSNTFTLLDCINQNQIFMNPENFEFIRFTGLKDKNGVEIYEGDIVRATKNYPGKDTQLFVSTFRKNTATFAFQETIPMSENDSCYFYAMLQIRDIEVIGNVYQNQDLLK